MIPSKIRPQIKRKMIRRALYRRESGLKPDPPRKPLDVRARKRRMFPLGRHDVARGAGRKVDYLQRFAAGSGLEVKTQT